MTRQPSDKINYLYGRLSHEDELQGDSNSIVNQRKILTRYAEENHFLPYRFVCDDGYSGADFERPAFSKMMEDVEAGKVSAVIVKDMSRFGRDYLKVGFYTEIVFPEKDVRLIAVNDNVDTGRGENDFTPMMNLFNEWFVRNTSKKIRAVWQAKLVNDLLFLARADAKSDTIQPEDFFLSDTVKKASAPFQSVMKEKNLLFERDIQIDIKMSGIEGRMAQLIVILLDNAVKNTQPGGRIKLTLSTRQGKARIEVSDTGTGIPEKQLEHIFERFYRTDTSRARDQGGAGLGLAIAQCIVQEHHGTIHVQSEVGSGTTFRVLFPI